MSIGGTRGANSFIEIEYFLSQKDFWIDVNLVPHYIKDKSWEKKLKFLGLNDDFKLTSVARSIIAFFNARQPDLQNLKYLDSEHKAARRVFTLLGNPQARFFLPHDLRRQAMVCRQEIVNIIWSKIAVLPPPKVKKSLIPKEKAAIFIQKKFRNSRCVLPSEIDLRRIPKFDADDKTRRCARIYSRAIASFVNECLYNIKEEERKTSKQKRKTLKQRRFEYSYREFRSQRNSEGFCWPFYCRLFVAKTRDNIHVQFFSFDYTDSSDRKKFLLGHGSYKDCYPIDTFDIQLKMDKSQRHPTHQEAVCLRVRKWDATKVLRADELISTIRDNGTSKNALLLAEGFRHKYWAREDCEDVLDVEQRKYLGDLFHLNMRLSAKEVNSLSLIERTFPEKFKGLIRTLEEVHAAGFVINDVKPVNTFIDEGGLAYLADFDNLKKMWSIDLEYGSIEYEFWDPLMCKGIVTHHSDWAGFMATIGIFLFHRAIKLDVYYQVLRAKEIDNPEFYPAIMKSWLSRAFPTLTSDDKNSWVKVALEGGDIPREILNSNEEKECFYILKATALFTLFHQELSTYQKNLVEQVSSYSTQNKEELSALKNEEQNERCIALLKSMDTVSSEAISATLLAIFDLAKGIEGEPPLKSWYQVKPSGLKAQSKFTFTFS